MRPLLLALALLPLLAVAGDFQITWDPPAPGAYGHPTSYAVYCSSSDYRAAPPTVTPPDQLWHRVLGAADGRYTCAAKSRYGVTESDFSNIVAVDCAGGVCGANVYRAPPRLDVAPIAYVVAPNASYPTRPLYDRADGARIGVVEVGRPCEGGPALKVTSSGEWRYTTNSAGLRGVALCRVQ